MEISEKTIEIQEHLNSKRMQMLQSTMTAEGKKLHDKTRPPANLIDLINWASSNFSHHLKDNTKVNSFIHNRISIDGSFCEYAETNHIDIKCLYQDSIASWKTENNQEAFVAQGIFLIKTHEVEFIQAALFHKGNQNEDEVSFFILVSQSNFEKYIELRNHYDKWLLARDRDNLEIYVVGGEGVSYTRDQKWDDLFLPDALKKEIKSSVEGWLASKEVYERVKAPWKRGVLLYGNVGTGKTSLIRTLISEYNFKPVTIEMGAHTTNDVLTEAFAYAQEQSPGLLYIEDIDTLFTDGQVSLSHFLNLMDGINTKNGIFIIGTANDLDVLKESITDRPSRFDKKWEIPLPDESLCFKYLKKWFGDLITDKKCTEFAKTAFKLHFSYAYLKELYLSSIFNALSFGRELPIEEDLQTAMKLLVGDKELAKKGHRNSRNAKIGI